MDCIFRFTKGATGQPAQLCGLLAACKGRILLGIAAQESSSGHPQCRLPPDGVRISGSEIG